MKLVERVIAEPDMHPGTTAVVFTDGTTSVDLVTFETGSFSAPHGDCTYDFFLYFKARLYSVEDRLIVDSYAAGQNGNFDFPDPDKSLQYHRMFISRDAGREWEEVTDSEAKQALRDEILHADVVSEI